MRAMVTGASEGIGRVFARRLAQEGYAITAVARNEQRLRDLIRDLPTGAHQLIVADLSTAEGVSKTGKALEDLHHDLLVNNAGFGVYGNFFEAPLPRIQEMTRLNCDALVALSHVFLKNAVRGDALLQVSSLGGIIPMPGHAVYAATKAFVTSFTESLWLEQKERGVFVMNLCPGPTTSLFLERSGAASLLIPRFLIQEAEPVVETALRALRRRRCPTVISGAVNRFAAFLSRLLPRGLVVRLAGRARKF